MAVAVAGCNQPAVAAIGLVGCAAFAVAACGWRSVGRTLTWLAPLALLIAVANPLLMSKGSTELFRIGHQGVYLEAFAYGLAMAAMLASMVLLFQGFSAAVAPSALRDLLGKRLPVTALVLSLGLRFVPQMTARLQAMRATDKANTALGEQSTSVGALSGRLMAWSLDDSLVQADSMRARGWGAGRRVAATEGRAIGRDRCELAVVLALGAAACGCAFWFGSGWVFYPAMPELAWSGAYLPIAAFALVPEAELAWGVWRSWQADRGVFGAHGERREGRWERR